MMVTRYDLDGHTLDEEPDLVLSTILDGAEVGLPEGGGQDLESPTVLAARLRARVPDDGREEFDERLAEARAAMDLRDDNGPNTVEFPVGLLRHALLEAGRRLAAAGRLQKAEHILEVSPDEASPLIAKRSGPSADELADRAQRRRSEANLDPPRRLGPEEKPPPLEVLAPAHRLMVGAVTAVLAHLGMAGDERTESLRGCGVGREPYRGRARVAADPESALDAMEPGDVLVVRFTTPAYNTVLAIAGAIVTADGALLSHAAVMARELGIPAVVGAAGALDEIPDGAEVEVDPVGGTVRVLAAPPTVET
jgi:pyruvate,water dikinase